MKLREYFLCAKKKKKNFIQKNFFSMSVSSVIHESTAMHACGAADVEPGCTALSLQTEEDARCT